MLNLNNVYNYYGSQVIAPKSDRSASHKKDDLKTIYNNMVKHYISLPSLMQPRPMLSVLRRLPWL